MGAASADVKSIFGRAMAASSPAERAAYLQEACGSDPKLRAEVEALLHADREAGSFLGERSPSPAATVDERVFQGPGTVIGPYTLREQIGEGGMGLVYVAEQQHPIRRKVALKVIKPGMDTRQVVARFEAERQALALMDHPHIARVLDGGETTSGQSYFVMELVRGMPITQFCDENRLTTRARLELFVGVCQAVRHAHQKGVIHRDLKPSNVLVTSHGGTLAAKVIDFGIAKAVGLRLTEKTLCTGPAQMIGTPLYLSPEQACLGGLDVDTRADIYALGVVLYELLTGATPFDRERLREAPYDEMRRIIREEPPRPSTRAGTLGPAAAAVSVRRQSDPRRLSQLLRGEVDWVVMKAMEKDRNRRYETPGAFAADIERYLRDEPVAAGPPSAWYRFRKIARRHRGALAMAAVVTAALVLGGGMAWWSERRQAAQKAREEALDDEVSRAVDEAEPLIDEGRWPESQVAMQHAEKLLAAAGRTEQPGRLGELQKDLALARRLEEIVSQPEKGDYFTSPEMNVEFGRAFREYGIDVTALPVEEAARLIRTRGIRHELARALDNWSATRSHTGGRAAADGGLLLEVAKATDPDPWRDQLRDAFRGGDRKALEALAASVVAPRLPPGTLYLLGIALLNVKAYQQAEAVLRLAHRQYPEDLRINDILGRHCYDTRPPQYDEAVRYHTAALVARPHNPYTMNRLAWALLGKGSAEEAAATFSRVLELKPDLMDALRGRAEAYLTLGEQDKAQADLGRVLVMEPRSATDWLNRGGLRRAGKMGAGPGRLFPGRRTEPPVRVRLAGPGMGQRKAGSVGRVSGRLLPGRRTGPQFAEALHGRGTAYSNRGQGGQGAGRPFPGP